MSHNKTCGASETFKPRDKISTWLYLCKKEVIAESKVSLVRVLNRNGSSNSSMDPEALLETSPGTLSNTREQKNAKGENSKSHTIDSTTHHHELDCNKSMVYQIFSSFVGTRVVLAITAAIYGTNFPIGAIMDENMPASVATSSRMALASISLSPFLFRLDPSLIAPTITCGAFSSLGYISQSIALIHVSPSTVSFLGATTVIVCPVLECLVDGRPMAPTDAPHVWLSAMMCLAGVAALELCNHEPRDAFSGISFGDGFALLQAVGFGTETYLKERMMRRNQDHALSITSCSVCTIAFTSIMWCLVDAWIGQSSWETFSLAALVFPPSFPRLPAAVLWTGIVSTALTSYMEILALGHVPSAEASVFLATEPLWAALFSSLLFHEKINAYDIFGGTLIFAACLVNLLEPSDIFEFFSRKKGGTQRKETQASHVRL